MRISEQWLREWVEIDADIEAIAERLTMAGLEVDAIEAAGADLNGVVIGEVVSCEPHPDADQLKVCEVDTGDARSTIVCGAPNVAVGARVPVATVGARLPGGMKIEAAKLRGVASNGMLCSAAELELSGDAAGLLLLPPSAPVGMPLADYLDLPDRVLEVELTPNRGDCLSMRGVAREAAVAFGVRFIEPDIAALKPDNDSVPTVSIEATDLCAAYGAQNVEGLGADAETPIWMRERLRRAGTRAINLPVDIGNYVMLELGQPMHAFDADKLTGPIRVRRAEPGERIITLDGEDVALLTDTLVIADDHGPVAIAGIIGGERTAVDDQTTRVTFESACFTPKAVAGQGRRYKIHTDALHRFERGVDPALHAVALERAVALLCKLGGGRCGPVVVAGGHPVWPTNRTIELNAGQIERLLGQPIAAAMVESSLTGLGADCEASAPDRWQVTPPSWRYDLLIEADLIEEVARVYGYDRLVTEAAGISLLATTGDSGLETVAPTESLRQRGYYEAITYSFVEPELHAELTGDARAISLDNPISDQMVVMRRTLWAGLLGSWIYNTHRQQSRVRLFEKGLRFWPDGAAEHGMAQIDTLSGLVAGQAHGTHWDESARPVDFFDVRGDVEALFRATGKTPRFRAEQHPALHPGRTARIVLDDRAVGWIGQLAPRFARRYKGRALPYLFEIDHEALAVRRTVRYESPSDQPRVTRDLALVVPEHIVAGDLFAAIESVRSDLVQSVDVFDVFRGEGLEKGSKSVALSLIFQDKTSTLSDDSVDRIIHLIVDALYTRCGARLRGE